LETYQPDSITTSPDTEARLRTGLEVGEVARGIYDPAREGILIDRNSDGFRGAAEKTANAIRSRQTIFEAAFNSAGTTVFVDILLPVKQRTGQWKLVEVKSSTSARDYHSDDIAIQGYIAREAGIQLNQVSLSCIDSSRVYPGKGNYRGLLQEIDMTEVLQRDTEVREWISNALGVLANDTEPDIATGTHCFDPFECGFYEYCSQNDPVVEHPVHWLPAIRSNKLKTYLDENDVLDMADIPDHLLNERQLRVKQATLSNKVYFDQSGAQQALSGYTFPAYFLDFETITFAVPAWAGTRPYQQLPFQFSLHKLGRSGAITHHSFLDLSGKDPYRGFATHLIQNCGKRGPVYVYNAGFESRIIRELAERLPGQASDLLAINDRLVDLYPVARNYYYHPTQYGSWSIKYVLPAIAPDLNYGDLEGVQHGGMAMEAYLEAIHPGVSPVRKSELEQQLLEYCKLDTWAMVRLWEFFTGKNIIKL